MELSEAATECLLATIEVVSNPDVGVMFYEFIGQNMAGLIKGVNRKIQDEEFDEAENYIRVMCEYGRHAGLKIIDELSQQSLVYIEHMIKYT